ncbi:MAG: TetR/AcrR family transcriptional regulator [Anaerolineales bacterium]|nr:TetR/AcrR family transcriptional regulator [Anaerolineales bacterium]
MAGKKHVPQRRDLSRQKILEKARKLFLAKGLAGLSMRKLAKELRYTPGAIYKHFDNKEEILQAIREESWAVSSAMDSEMPPGLSTRDLLVESARQYLRFAAAYPDHYQLMFNTPDLPYGAPEDVRKDPHFAPVIAMVERGVQSGEIQLPAGFDAAMLAFQMWITVHGAAMLRLTIMNAYGKEFDRFFDNLLVTMIDNTVRK